MLLSKKIRYFCKSAMYSLFLPLHIMNTLGSETLKLFQIPVAIMGLYALTVLPRYYRSYREVRLLVWFLLCVLISFTLGGLSILRSYLTVSLIILSVIPFIDLNKSLFVKLTPPLYLISLVYSYLYADYSNVLFRFTGLYNDPNFLVMSIILGDFICFYAFKNTKIIIKAISIVAILFSIYLLLLTQSRGGLIAFGILCFFGLLELYKTKKTLVFIILGTVFISSGSLTVKYYKNIQKYAERFDGMASGQEGSAKTRILQLKAIAQGVSEYPETILLGVGIGKTHDCEIPIWKRPDNVITERYQYQHQIHVTPAGVFFEDGILAFICYLIFMIDVFLRVKKSKNLFCMGLYLAATIQSLTIPSLPYLPYWVALIMCIQPQSISKSINIAKQLKYAYLPRM